MSTIGGSNFRFEWHGDKLAEDVRAATSVGIGVAAVELATQMKVNLTNRGVSAPGAMPGFDTGQLRGSIVSQVTSPTTARAGTALPYGRWLEYGFRSTAKGKSSLPVPLNREARRMLRQAQNKGGLRSVPNLVLITRKGKPPLLVQTRGKGTKGGKQWKPMFVLKKSIVVAPRPWVRRSAAMARAKMNKAFIDHTTKALASRIVRGAAA